MRLMAFMVALAGPAAAQDWESVAADEVIFESLAGRTIIYDAYTTQYFGPDGDTRFVTERAADGRWTARGGQYCSQWPPSDRWDCYDIQLRGDDVKFIGADQSESVGTLQK